MAVALGLEIVLAVSMFALPPLRALLAWVSAGIDGLQAATLEGARFVFGYLAGGATPYVLASPENSTVLAFGVLPLIIVVSALSALCGGACSNGPAEASALCCARRWASAARWGWRRAPTSSSAWSKRPLWFDLTSNGCRAPTCS